MVPNGTGDWDDVYIQVSRDIFDPSDGETFTLYDIERIEQPLSTNHGTAQQDAFYVDCGGTLSLWRGQTLIFNGGDIFGACRARS